MTSLRTLLLALVSLSAGCFGSSVDVACESPCAASEVAVDFCDLRDDACRTVTDCAGEAQFCVTPTCRQARPVCDGIEVTSCEGWDSCEALPWCDSFVHCAEPMVCTEPMCARGEVLVSGPCPASGGDVACEERRSCGGEVYSCVGGALCDGPPPTCPPDMVWVERCDPNTSPTCRTFVGCGVTYCEAPEVCTGRFPVPPIACGDGVAPSPDPCTPEELRNGTCYEIGDACNPLYCRAEIMCDIAPPCFDLEGVVDEGPGFCPPGTTCLQRETGCTGLDPYYCITACPIDARWIGDRFECPTEGGCFPHSPFGEDGDVFWCQQVGPSCLAIPSCDPGDFEIGFFEECPADADCYFSSTCGTSVHCERRDSGREGP
ncbi:MAG: hypothetical protein AAF411_28420 [Myxococcota bacterium]